MINGADRKLSVKDGGVPVQVMFWYQPVLLVDLEVVGALADG